MLFHEIYKRNLFCEAVHFEDNFLSKQLSDILTLIATLKLLEIMLTKALLNQAYLKIQK